LLSQSKIYTDSLLTVLQKQNGDTNRVTTLCRLSEAYLHSEFLRSKNYATEALELSEKLNYNHGRIMSLNRLGSVLESESNYKASLEILFKALALAQSTGDKEYISMIHNTIGLNYSGVLNYNKAIEHFHKAISNATSSTKQRITGTALCNMGNTYVLKAQFDSATTCFLKASNIFEKLKDPDRMGTCLHNLGNIYYRITNYEKALDYYRKCIPVFEVNRNKQHLADCLQGIGGVYYDQGKYNDAFDYFFKSLKIKEEIGDKRSMVGTLINIGALYSGIDQYDKGILYLNRADSINSQVEHTGNKLAILNNVGYAFLNSGRLQEALQKFKSYYELAQQTHSNDDIRVAAYNLSNIYSALKDYKQAYEFHKLYSLMNDSILSNEKKSKIEELVFNNEMDRKEEELKVLKTEATIKELQLQQSESKNLLLISALICFVAVTSLLFLLYRQFQKRKDEKEKMITQENILRAVVETKEHEQKRVAEELHDSLGQILSTLKLRISAFKEGQDVSHIDASLELIKQASQEVKTISHDLMPHVLMELGLKKALVQLSTNVNNSGNLKLTIKADELNENLPELTGILIYRITQELVNNIIKHAGATTASITFSKKDNQLFIVAEDNGKGFDKEDFKDKNGMGWKGMTSRILMFKGSYEIKRSDSGGSRIEIKLDIQK
jgi:signal transduction histidine kinase